MFTGIIQDIGKIQRLERRDQGLRLDIATLLDLSAVKLGDSVAVDGACLTVIQKTPSTFSVEAGKETLEQTTLSTEREGQRVNLETSLRMSDPLGGHFVSGHVDGTGEIIEVNPEGNSLRYRFRAPQEIGRFLIEKGSVAVDGISLTVAECQDQEFRVSVLSYTAQKTTLGMKKAGDRVNLENDMISKYVAKFVSQQTGSAREGSRLDWSFLAEHGFVKK